MDTNKLLILPIVLISILISISSCDKNKKNPISENDEKELCEGLCIYPTQIEQTSDLSYQTIDPASAPIVGQTIISYDDIITYDTTTHILSLSYPMDSIKVDIGVYGEPFIVTLDSDKIYGGWFWTPISSIPCHWVVIEPDALFDTLSTNEIRIKLGYPTETEFIGEDPRNNRQIFNRLIKDGKVR